MVQAGTKPSMHDRMTVTLPEMDIDGMQVDRFVVRDHENLLMAIHYGGRRTSPGEYTRLTVDGCLWMSDTDAEKRDHIGPLFEIERRQAGRVLINGLGLGMVVQAALSFDHVEHVDVVERDPRVAEHIGAYYSRRGAGLSVPPGTSHGRISGLTCAPIIWLAWPGYGVLTVVVPSGTVAGAVNCCCISDSKNSGTAGKS